MWDCGVVGVDADFPGAGGLFVTILYVRRDAAIAQDICFGVACMLVLLAFFVSPVFSISAVFS